MLYNTTLKNILFIIVACVVVFFSACQKTPESEAIVSKGDGLLDQLVLEKADPNEGWSQFEDWIVWEETKNVNTEIGNCTVTVSMDVKMPGDPGHAPVYLIEPGELSMGQLRKTAEYLLLGEKYDGAVSKQDIMTEKLTFQKDISTHTIIDRHQSEVEDYLAYFDEEYNKAAESNKEARFEFFENEQGQNVLFIKSYADDNTIMRFNVFANRMGQADRFCFRGVDINTVFRYLNEIPDESIEVNGTEMTYSQALTIANNAMIDLFEEPYAMAHTDIIHKTNYVEYLWNDGKPTSLGQAYVFCYTREYDGVPSLYIAPATTTMTEKTEYAKPYIREYVDVVVDDRGIVYMTCYSFSDTIKQLNDNVKMMPFNELLDRFKKNVFYHSLWGRSAEITITQIEFGLVREPVKDNAEQYMMVPAWNFVGDVSTDWMQEREKSILVLNAVTGSIAQDYETIVDPK